MTMEAEFDSVNFKGSILAAPIDYGAMADVFEEFLRANGFEFKIIYEEEIAEVYGGLDESGEDTLPSELEDRIIIAICRSCETMPQDEELVKLVCEDEVVAPTSD